MTYWNKNIQQWTLPSPPPQKSYRSSWIKFNIGKHAYYGRKLDSWRKAKIVVLKIIPLFLTSITLAPITIPLFFRLRTYRKLGIWIREVHYSKTIKYIVNCADKSLSMSKSPMVSMTEDNASDSNHVINHFNRLPNEITALLLTTPSLSNSSEVRRYLQSLACVSKSMQPFVEQAKLNLINAGIISIAELPGIDRNLDKALAYVDSVKAQLKNLNLAGLNPSEEDIKTLLLNCPNLTSLNLRGCCNITDKGLAEVAKLTSLTSLNLGGCYNIKDKGLAEVAKLTSLTSLDLGGCNQITDKGLEEVAKLTSLTSLDLGWCKQITDKGLEEVAKLTFLTSLDLWGCNQITDKGLAEST